MIAHGSNEFRRYWKAWYDIERASREANRKELHRRFGLPSSHREFTATHLETWERRCTEEIEAARAAELTRAAVQKFKALPEEERARVSAAFREREGLPAGTKIAELGTEQIVRFLALIHEYGPRGG